MAEMTKEQKEVLVGLNIQHGVPDEVIIEDCPEPYATMYVIWWNHPPRQKRGLVLVKPDGKRGTFKNYA